VKRQGVFFAAHSSAVCTTNMFGFDFRQAQPRGTAYLRLRHNSRPRVLPDASGAFEIARL
jgi:hypothetical protein